MINNTTYLFTFYPNLRWQLVLILLLGIFYYPNKYQFIMIYLLVFVLLLYFYRRPKVDDLGGEAEYQVCNIDGTCRTVARTMEDKGHVDILSAAYGTIEKVVEEGEWVRIVCVLTIFDVHAQFSPTTGTVESIKYKMGQFNTAGLFEKCEDNESQEIIIRSDYNGELVKIKQIAGMITRRISSGVTEGKKVHGGDYIGFIHLGSRVDMYLPKDKVQLYVKKNDQVRGFNTIIGRWS